MAPEQHDQPARQPGHPVEREQQDQGDDSHRERGPARIAEVRQQVDELPDRVTAALFQAENLRQLADGHEDGQPEDEPSITGRGRN